MNDIVKNFLALVVIAQFGEYFYTTVLKKDPLNDFVGGQYEDFLII